MFKKCIECFLFYFKIVANSFLASPHTSATFATILVGYLLERLEDMGTPGERANLYLKLFKVLIFSFSIAINSHHALLFIFLLSCVLCVKSYHLHYLDGNTQNLNGLVLMKAAFSGFR